MLDFIMRYAFVLIVGAIVAGFAKHLRDSPRVGAPALAADNRDSETTHSKAAQ
jgi:hypothetical protein